ncbi:MAG: aminodeoxychorismate synthase component I [Mycolicibacterium insubricum]|nr:aminodeoxychorismate synthase component I [Mycobacterium sp.]
MRIERLADLGPAPEVLRRLSLATARRGLPGPAALTGDWFGCRALIAPSLATAECAPAAVFEAGPTIDGPPGAVGGGWLGYLSYPDPGADVRGPRIPVAAGGWTDSLLRRDADGTWWYECLSGAPMPGWLSDALTEREAGFTFDGRREAGFTHEGGPGNLADAHRPAGSWHIDWHAPDPRAHRAGVLACLEAIADGEVYQACVCTQFTGRLTGSACAFFADAVAATDPARGAFLAGPWGAVASLSPELFLSRRGELLTSSPIKGTVAATADPAALRASVKDVAENVMIVDLVRNDLSRVAHTGSVTVTELLAIKPAPGVWHLVSTVTAQVAAAVPMRNVLEATFPPASVTGTPKRRARELLAGWEPHRRGIYCGTVGIASPLAGTELNVAIRTVEFDAAGRAVLGVGGGITADSDPDAEWDECLHKAAPTLELMCSDGSCRAESAPAARAR